MKHGYVHTRIDTLLRLDSSFLRKPQYYKRQIVNFLSDVCFSSMEKLCLQFVFDTAQVVETVLIQLCASASVAIKTSKIGSHIASSDICIKLSFSQL